jgi:hypothetical protein
VTAVYVALACIALVLLAVARRGAWKGSKHGSTSAAEARRMADDVDDSGMRRDLEGMADEYDGMDSDSKN